MTEFKAGDRVRGTASGALATVLADGRVQYDGHDPSRYRADELSLELAEPAPPEFRPWPKIPRLNREIVITEKIDGTNAAIVVMEDGRVYAQSRKRLITPESDNFGFAAWVAEFADELRVLGPGHHYGEWYGRGIQRGYGLDGRRFALFAKDRYAEVDVPPYVQFVPELYRGPFNYYAIKNAEWNLREQGSFAVPGFMHPEGFIVFHTAARQAFKVLLENDDIPKGLAA